MALPPEEATLTLTACAAAANAEADNTLGNILTCGQTTVRSLNTLPYWKVLLSYNHPRGPPRALPRKQELQLSLAQEHSSL